MTYDIAFPNLGIYINTLRNNIHIPVIGRTIYVYGIVIALAMLVGFLSVTFIAKSKNQNVEDSFLWVKNAGLAIPAYNAKDLSLPLVFNSDRNIMKVFYEDVGLLNSISLSKEVRLNLLKEDMNINFGSIYENFVAEEFNAHGFENIYYYNNKRNGELDFVIEHNAKTLPIEVKSGKDYKRHSAMNKILNIENYDIDEAYVFNNKNVVANGKIKYLPIYMASLLR